MELEFIAFEKDLCLVIGLFTFISLDTNVILK